MAFKIARVSRRNVKRVQSLLRGLSCINHRSSMRLDIVIFGLKSKHRHQRYTAPRLCNTFFIKNIWRLKIAGDKCFSQRFFHNIFLTMSLSQRLSHNTFVLTKWFSQRHNIRVIFLYVLHGFTVAVARSRMRLTFESGD